MSTAKYGPTPPNVHPLSDGSGNEEIVAPGGGVLKTMTSEVMGLGVFADAAVHDLAPYAVLPDRTFQVSVYVEGHDAANMRSLSGAALLQITRYGSGNVQTPVGTPLLLNFTPQVGPWDSLNVTAGLVILPSGKDIAVRVQSIIPGVTIRWRATIKAIGAQVQLVV